MKRVLILVLLLAFGLIIGCNNKSQQVQPPPVKTITLPKVTQFTEKDLNIQVKPEEQFALNLPTEEDMNWRVDDPLNEKILKKVGFNHLTGQDIGKEGTGGMDVWTFQAVKKGTTTIKMGYYKMGSPDTKTVVFNVTVK